MKLDKLYKAYRSFMYIFLVLSFASAIYYYNEVQTLRKIVKTNTDIKTDIEIDNVIKDIQVYDKTGKLPDLEHKKPLDKLIDKMNEVNKSKIVCDDYNAVCKEFKH